MATAFSILPILPSGKLRPEEIGLMKTSAPNGWTLGAGGWKMKVQSGKWKVGK